MIGNAWPVDATGYSVLEWGELDRQTRSLRVTAYVVADRHGELLLGQHPSREAAEVAARGAAEATMSHVQKSDSRVKK